MELVLGIESSCDETAAAIVRADRTIVAQRIASQDDAHRPYGGVVPEIAARAHVERLTPLIKAVLDEAGMELRDMDAIAATAGPGLIGGVMVGLVTAKALAMAGERRLIAVNHLEGHALSPRLADPALGFPYLLLLASGGHCQLLLVEGVGRYRRLATTIDDALGEAFDKTAKILGLGYPGGPAVERLARQGDPRAVPLPRPLKGSAEPHFSFAGLKSAVLRAHESGLHDTADIAASFQQAAIDCVIDRTRKAIEAAGPLPALVVAGGVAANQSVRAALESLAASHAMRFVAPPLALCTDNAAMIAWAGLERLASGQDDPLDFAARPRWPLDPDAEPVRGAGGQGMTLGQAPAEPAIGVLGAGAWGTALAQSLASDGTEVLIWAREAELVAEINASGTNSLYLPGVTLAPTVRAAASLADVAGCDVLLGVVPAQFLASVLGGLPQAPRDLVLCAKGIEAGTGRLMADVARDALPGAALAVLSGPTFAHEVAAGLPTAVTLACSAGEAQWHRLSAAIARPAFRPYYSDDITGAEIGGAVKNVLAIACGVVEGLGLGQNARAALIARGYAEMLRFGLARGARAETLSGLCGMGDLVLTCSSTSSRNFSLGKALGEGMSADQALAGKNSVAEGAATAPVLAELAMREGLDMPIVLAVSRLLAGEAPARQIVSDLLARPLRAEQGPGA